MISPYVTGKWVTGPQFYGRECLIEIVLHGQDDNLWFIGNRRVGKTSLLKEIARRTVTSQRYLPLYWEMSASQTEADFIDKLHEAVEDAQLYSLDPRWTGFTFSPPASLRQALRQLAAWTQAQNLRLLLLCDEVEGLLYLAETAPKALQDLRHTLQNHPAIRPVLASTRRLSLLYEYTKQWNTSAFLDGFARHYLLHFRDDTANQVIAQTQSATPLGVAEPLLAQIRHATGNHPLLLQKLCHQLFDSERGNLRPLLPTDLEPDIQLIGFFEYDFNGLTSDEAKLLRHIHTSPCTLSDLSSHFPHTNLKLCLRNLNNETGLGFLRQIENTFHISNLFLAHWLDAWPLHQTPQAGITDDLLTQEKISSLRRQLRTHHQALNLLQEQAAKFGLSVPTNIQLEINDHQIVIADIETELTELGENITPSKPPRPE